MNLDSYYHRRAIEDLKECSLDRFKIMHDGWKKTLDGVGNNDEPCVLSHMHYWFIDAGGLDCFRMTYNHPVYAATVERYGWFNTANILYSDRLFRHDTDTGCCEWTFLLNTLIDSVKKNQGHKGFAFEIRRFMKDSVFYDHYVDFHYVIDKFFPVQK